MYEHEPIEHASMPSGTSFWRSRVRRLLTNERCRWWMVFFVLATLAAVRAATSMERDPYWSARAGLENLAGAPLVRPDTWSWSTEGDWYPNSPGWNVVLGLGWQSLGFWGIFAVAFGALSLMFGLALLLSHFAGARALPSLVGFVPLLLIATSGLSPRATVVVQCLILGSVLFAWWWGTVAIRIPSAAAAAGVGAVGFFVSLLGNWVHLSFMLMAAVLALLWAIAWWATPSLSANSRLGLILSGTAGLFLGCVFSPYGIPLTLERSRIVEAVCRDLITEWMSIFTFIRNGQYQVLVTTVLAIVALIISVTWVALLIRREGRFDPRVRLVLPLAVFGSIAMVAGLGTVRFIAVGAVALLPVAAGATTWIVDRFRHYQRKGLGFWGRPRVVEFTSGRFLTALVLLVGILMTPLAGIRIATGARPAEVAVIEMLPEKCNVWSEDRAAGLVILIRPDVKVWIDGRVDYYGREHLLRYLRILSGKESLPDDAGCVILPTVAYERTALGNILDENREWTRIAQQDGYVLWVRD